MLYLPSFAHPVATSARVTLHVTTEYNGRYTRETYLLVIRQRVCRRRYIIRMLDIFQKMLSQRCIGTSRVVALLGPLRPIEVVEEQKRLLMVSVVINIPPVSLYRTFQQIDLSPSPQVLPCSDLRASRRSVGERLSSSQNRVVHRFLGTISIGSSEYAFHATYLVSSKDLIASYIVC